MKYPHFYEMYKNAIKNTWTVEEVDFSMDVTDLRNKMTPAERHLINRLVAFFATGDSIVSNNLVLNLYKHINAPEARMYLSRQLYEEALHVQFYLTLLDTYIPDHAEREAAFAAVENIPSIRKKAEFCLKWIDSIQEVEHLNGKEDRQKFLLNLICFATCIEGLFFFAAFAYVYFLRSKGLLHGLASGTNWVFRDESGHMAFALDVVKQIRKEESDLFDESLNRQIVEMLDEAVSEWADEDDLTPSEECDDSPRAAFVVFNESRPRRRACCAGTASCRTTGPCRCSTARSRACRCWTTRRTSGTRCRPRWWSTWPAACRW